MINSYSRPCVSFCSSFFLMNSDYPVIVGTPFGGRADNAYRYAGIFIVKKYLPRSRVTLRFVIFVTN